jgi:hypothetical protein
MSDLLVNHALKNVWCAPDQDNQFIFQLARLTPYGGTTANWRVLMTSVTVPLPGQRFHLFQIGQVNPTLVDLFPRMHEWMRLSDTSVQLDTICDVYLGNGLRINSTDCWYIVTEERNVIVAVKDNRQTGLQPNIGVITGMNLSTQPIYLRVYKNAYYNSERWMRYKSTIAPVVINSPVVTKGRLVSSIDDLLLLQQDYLLQCQLPGSVVAYRNGYRVRDISLLTCKAGDLVEYVYDASVYRIQSWAISELMVFDSELDKKGKYLLVGGQSDLTTIDYQDDIDIWVVDSNTGQGVYCHKNAQDTLRMVTHQDYAIAVAQIRSILDDHPGFLTTASARIELRTRHSGYHRKLIDEHHRIKELYKLPAPERTRAMVGMASTVKVWQASALEASSYTRTMRSDYLDITPAMVVDMLGYNAVTDLVGKPVMGTELLNLSQAVRVPALYQKTSTGFEYDADGRLLGWRKHEGGDWYTCVNPTAHCVELVYGVCDVGVDDYLNANVVVLDPKWDYRFYIREKISNPQLNVWKDVTGDSSKYLVKNGQATWGPIKNTYDTLVRSNQKTLILNKRFNLSDGLMVFNLTEKRMVNGSLTERIMEVPMGELDVFLNQRSLIEGLDYFVDYPRITIVNKTFLKAVGDQNVMVRFRGLCTKGLGRTDVSEVGYVVNGCLSVDHEYDVRDDRNTRLVVHGGTYLSNDVIFQENVGNVKMLSTLNGKPYAVKDYIVPIRQYTGLDTYAFRQKSVEVDQEVSTYLTSKLVQTQVSAVNPIESKYIVYSPMLSKLISDMRAGLFDPLVIKTQYNDNQVMSLLAPYLYLLSTDPLHPDNRPDAQYVQIHPHHLSTVVDLTIYQYTFLNRVIRLYAKDVVVLSNHARIV